MKIKMVPVLPPTTQYFPFGEMENLLIVDWIIKSLCSSVKSVLLERKSRTLSELSEQAETSFVPSGVNFKLVICPLLCRFLID